MMSDRAENPNRRVSPTIPREQFDAVLRQRDETRVNLERCQEALRGLIGPDAVNGGPVSWAFGSIQSMTIEGGDARTIARRLPASPTGQPNDVEQVLAQVQKEAVKGLAAIDEARSYLSTESNQSGSEGKRAIQREAQLLRDIATWCEGQAEGRPLDSTRAAYRDVRDHCLNLAETRRP